jgi:hypothetical protein
MEGIQYFSPLVNRATFFVFVLLVNFTFLLIWYTTNAVDN